MKNKKYQTVKQLKNRNIVETVIKTIPQHTYWGCMVFNATFNNISVISWWSVLLVEET